MLKGLFGPVCALMLFGTSTAPLSAQIQVPDLLRQLSMGISRDVANASSEVQATVAQIPAVNQENVRQVQPITPEKSVAVVTDKQKALLVSAVDKYTNEKQREAGKFSMLATTFMVLGAVLALLGSICSFLRRNTVAGVVGLVVVAIVSAPNLYPMNAMADFYGALATQAVALQTDCNLKNPFTVTDYESSEAQLKVLILYEAQTRPTFNSSKTSTEDLAAKLQSLRSSSNVSIAASH
jgi:hypothetical protein